MTETEFHNALMEIMNEQCSEERYMLKRRRRLRRINRIRKNEDLFKIINLSGYAPHRGYVDWEFTGTTLLHSGAYIKYPKNSNCQKWIKKETGRRIRNCKDVPSKGNYYRRLFDYWWTLY